MANTAEHWFRSGHTFASWPSQGYVRSSVAVARSRGGVVRTSKYFLIVSQCNGQVLDFDSDHGSGLMWLNEANGGPNQLWRWDEACRLVTKLGPVAEIKRNHKNVLELMTARNVSEGLGQKWRVEEGAIRSSLNDRVIDVPSAHLISSSSKSSLGGWLFEMPCMSNFKAGSQTQKWNFIPEDAWNDFQLVQADPNPLNKAQFWKKLVDNYLDVIIGYNIKDYETKVHRAFEIMDECADKLEQVTSDTGIAETVGASASTAGGGMALVGLLLAPFSGGLSLGLTVAGAATGVAGAVTSLTSSLVSQHWDKSEAKKVNEATAPVFRATLGLQGLLNEYIKNLKEAYQFLKTPKGRVVANDAYTITEKVGTAGSIAWNTYKIGKTAVTAAQHAKHAKEIRSVVDFIQADYYALNGARVGLATHAAAPEVAILGKTIVAAGTTSAKVISGSMAVFGIAFGAWDIVESAKKISNGSELAREFRKSSQDLKKESAKLIKLYQELTQK